MQNNQIFIFAAGYGKRMLPLTKATPKPLIKVKGLTLIEHLLLKLRAQNYTQITINVGHLGNAIIDHLGNGESYGMNITYSVEGKDPKETAGGLRFAITNTKLSMNKPIITINSDLFTNFDFSSLNDINPKKCHLVLIENPEHNPEGDFGTANGLLTNKNAQHTYTYSGIGVFSPEFILQNDNFDKIGKLIRQYIASNDITCEIFDGTWHDIGTKERLEQLELEL
jgi:N-acetyl-alpha-D-muramate 1-phosphate uridylyltransferase